MKFCENCGKEIVNETVGCENCNNNQPNGDTCEETKNSFQAIINNMVGKKLNNKIVAIVLGVLVAVIGIVIISNGNNALIDPSANSANENKMTYEEAYIQSAKSIMGEFIINPSSAVFYKAIVVETDDYGRAIVYLDFSAENTAGGSNRSRVYVCVQEVDLEGNYKFYRDYCYVSVSNSDASYMSDMKMSTLKSMNKFGEPKA